MVRQKIYDTLHQIGQDWVNEERAARAAGEQTHMTENAGIVGHLTLKLAQFIKPPEASLTDAAIDKA